MNFMTAGRRFRAPVALALVLAFLGSLMPLHLALAGPFDRGYQDAWRRGDRGYRGGDRGYIGGNRYYSGDPAGRARLGRTLGGAAGIAAGSFGGAALAAAVIKSAGLASMGPIVPILVGTAITAGAGFLGAKIFSNLGQKADRALGPGTTWTLVGAIAGSVLGYALIPALGPFAGSAGRIVAAATAGLAGGILAKLFAPQLDKVATPRNIYAATGAIIGGVGFGPLGAVGGAVGGWALGSIFDKVFFADRYSRGMDEVTNPIRDSYYDVRDKWDDFKYTVGDWFGGRLDRFGNRMARNWHYYDRPSYYYDDYYDSRDYAYDYIGRGQRPIYDQMYDVGFRFDQDRGFGLDFQYQDRDGGDLVSIRARYDREYRRFTELNSRGGSEKERYDSYRRLQELKIQMDQLEQSHYRR